MGGITAIISVVALLVGLASLWMATEAIKKVESRAQRMIEVHIKAIKQTIAEQNIAVKKMREKVEKMEGKIKAATMNKEGGAVEVDALAKDLENLKKQLRAGSTRQKTG